MVNFLELTPKFHTERFVLETADGTVELDLGGVNLGTLAAIAKRFPAFTRIIEGAGGGSIIEASEAMPALIAAGLGHADSPEYEAKIGQFAAADIMTMAMTVLRLTFPARESSSDPPPLAADGAAGDIVILPSALSS
jgi:hypothetical protein